MTVLDNILNVLTYDAEQPMIFSSGTFLWLFLGFTFIYMCLQKKMTARLVFVTLFSYFFYYKSSGVYFFLLAVVTVSDWLIGGQIGKILDRNPENKGRARWLIALSVIIDLSLLAYFKYTNFFLGSISEIIGNNFQQLPALGHLPARGYQFLHLPEPELHHRHLSSRDTALAVAARLCILRVVLPAIGGRTYREGP